MGVVSELLWRFLEDPYQRVQAEEITNSNAIVVLSGSRHPAPGKAKILEWKDPDRFLAGVQLFKKGRLKSNFYWGL